MLRLIRDFVSVRDLCFLYGSALVWVWISCCAGLSGYYMGALRWDGRDARYCIENQSTLFAHFCRFRRDEPENEANPARSSHVRLKHAQDKSCGLAAEIQARIRRCSRVRAAGSVCSFSRGGRKTMVFLALFHVKQSRFRTADPHRSASLCHSEEPATKNLRTWRMGWP